MNTETQLSSPSKLPAYAAVLVGVILILSGVAAFFGYLGLLLVTAAVFVERQRTRLIARAQEWREALERWE